VLSDEKGVNVNEERQRYCDYLNELKGLKGDLHFEGSEAGGYPIVEFRLKPHVEGFEAAFVLASVQEDFVVFEGLRDMRVKSVAVPLTSLIVVKEAPMATGVADLVPPTER
jgi:hypothetical protein